MSTNKNKINSKRPKTNFKRVLFLSLFCLVVCLVGNSGDTLQTIKANFNEKVS